MSVAKLYTGISAGGVLVKNADPGRLTIQNVGTAIIAVYYTSDGSGDPVAQLAGGVANDDGLGAVLTDDVSPEFVWLKAAAGGGRALVTF